MHLGSLTHLPTCLIVGRTPWSARDALVPPSRPGGRLRTRWFALLLGRLDDRRIKSEDSHVTKLVGIARMAAESAPLDTKRRVEYRELPARSYLAKCDSPRVPFRW